MARLWLKNLRKKNKITQAEMADLLGISQNFYSNIENGKRRKKLPMDMAASIAAIFDITLNEIWKSEQKGVN